MTSRHGRDTTRRMSLGEQAEAAATSDSRGTYPRPENPELSQLDLWDRNRAAAPKPIRDLASAARWVRAIMLVAAALMLLVVCVVLGVPR